MKKRILIVDDDIITLKILKKYLEERFEIITESAGYRFVEKMDTYDVDLILLDLEMPIVNGLQAFESLLKNPKLKDTPVAFLSGVSNPNLVRDLMQKGALGYIIKTTPKAEIIAKVEKMLKENKTRTVSPEIIILEKDVEKLAAMKDALVAGRYKVRTARTVVEVLKYIEIHDPNLFIIGTDLYDNSPQEIYDYTISRMREKGIQVMVMNNYYFSTELIERVEQVLK